MAITNFIPTIWSENLASALEKKYVAVSHCNREYEGEIKNMGSVVKICGVGNITVGDYTKDTDMSNPQTLSDTVTELTIDQAKYFNFQIDDIDKAQCTPRLMEAAMKVAASSLANVADRYVYSLAYDAANTITIDNPSPSDVLLNIIEARRMLYENNVSDSEEVVLEISPKVATSLIQDSLIIPTTTIDMLDPGCLGTIAGCKVYVTNNLYQSIDDYRYACLMRTKRAIAFAEQFSEIDAYRPEKRFADAVKGLHLYGAKVVYPNEMVCLAIGYDNH